MAIKLEVTGENVADFAANFRALIGTFIPVLQHGMPRQPLTPSDMPPNGDNPATPDTQQEPERDVPAKTKRNAKKADEPKQTDLEEKIAETKVTIEDVRAKLKELGAKKNHDAVYEVLKEYGVRKASEVPAEKYSEVIAKVNKALEG